MPPSSSGADIIQKFFPMSADRPLPGKSEKGNYASNDNSKSSRSLRSCFPIWEVVCASQRYHHRGASAASSRFDLACPGRSPNTGSTISWRCADSESFQNDVVNRTVLIQWA